MRQSRTSAPVRWTHRLAGVSFFAVIVSWGLLSWALLTRHHVESWHIATFVGAWIALLFAAAAEARGWHRR
jgi:cytochrome bd-type quinol oxidase subunit 1